MYNVIAYHGTGNKEVENDLRLLWDNLHNFAKSRSIMHAYCFQAVRDKKEADLLLVIQYEDNVAAASYAAQEIGHRKMMQPHNRVDYWLYIRNTNTQKKEASNE